MSNHKKKGKQKVENKIRHYTHIIQDACNFASGKNNLAKLLMITDEIPIQEIEKTLNKNELQAFQMYLANDIKKMPKLDNRDPETSKTIMQKYPHTVEDAFQTSATIMMSDMITDGTTQFSTTQNIFELVAQAEQDLPDKYHEGDIYQQASNHISHQYTDAFTSAFGDIIQWDSIIHTDNMAVWCKNILNLLPKIVTPERIEMFNSFRNHIVLRMIEISADLIPEFITKAKYSLQDLGYTIDDQPTVPNTISTPPFLSQKAKNDLIINKQLNIKPYLEPAPEWVKCVCISLQFVTMNTILTLREKLYNEFEFSHIIYTIISLIANAEQMKRYPFIIENFKMFLILQRLSSEACHQLLSPEDTSDNFLFHTCELHKYSPELMKQRNIINRELEKQGKTLSNVEPDSTSLWQIIALNTRIIPTPELYIRLKWKPILENLGYTSDEALTICGFIEGCNMSYKHTATSHVYFSALESIYENEEQSDDISQQENIDSLRTEFEAQIAKIHAEANNKLTEEKRKALKERRQANFEASNQEAKIQELTNTNDELLKKIKRLEAEKRQLQNTIAELNSSSTNEDDIIENENDIPTTVYPSNIGKDIKIVCVGGSVNWIATQQKRFPNIRFFSPDNPNETAISGADIILINTFTMNHSTFGIVQAICKKTGKELFYFPNRGMNTSSQYIEQVYQNYCQEQELQRKDTVHET